MSKKIIPYKALVEAREIAEAELKGFNEVVKEVCGPKPSLSKKIKDSTCPFPTESFMVWPVPGERMNEIEWQLRYGEPSNEMLLGAASVVAAYRHLVLMTQKDRQYIIREIKKDT